MHKPGVKLWLPSQTDLQAVNEQQQAPSTEAPESSTAPQPPPGTYTDGDLDALFAQYEAEAAALRPSASQPCTSEPPEQQQQPGTSIAEHRQRHAATLAQGQLPAEPPPLQESSLQQLGGSRAEALNEDELDRLTAQYEVEAAAARWAAAAAAAQPAPVSQKGMAQLREEGLATALPAENKGYKLLAAMGYKAGQGLGRGQAGRSTPLQVALKAGRAGLGVEEQRRKRKEQAQALQQQQAAKRVHQEELKRGVFQRHQAGTFAGRRAEGRLKEARRVCETLDKRQRVEGNPYWPPEHDPGAIEAEEEEEEEEVVVGWEALPPQQRLMDVLTYLRQRHTYCLFCGCQYTDEADLLANCPGMEEADH